MSAPPGIATAARFVARLAIWLLSRPFVVGVRVALASSAAGAALGAISLVLGLPWWVSAVFFVAACVAAGVVYGWKKLAKGGDRPVVYLAQFAHESDADAGASAQHSYLLYERLRANELLEQGVEIRRLGVVSRDQAQRIARQTGHVVISGHAVTAGNASRWEAVCSVPWPEVQEGVHFFHSPLGAFHHSGGDRRVFADSERLAVDAGVPIEFLVSATIAAHHIDAIEGTLLVLASAYAELTDHNELAGQLLAASDGYNAALGQRALALREVTRAVLLVKAAGVGSRRQAIERAEAAASEIDHADLWGFLIAAWYVGEFEGWSTPEDRERAARGAAAGANAERSYHVDIASALIAQGEVDRARAMLEEVLASGSFEESFGAHLHLGVIAYNAGDFDGAERHYSAALGPVRMPPVLVSLGDAKARLGKYDEALSLIKEALSRDPLYTRGHIAYANALVASRIGEGTLVMRGLFGVRHVAYPMLLVPDSFMSRLRVARGLVLVYLRWALKRHPEQPTLLLLLSAMALYRREFRVASLLSRAVTLLPLQDAARAAALTAVADALAGDIDAIATLDWIRDQETSPTIPVAVREPAVYSMFIRQTFLIPFVIERSLEHEPGMPEFLAAVAERFYPGLPYPPQDAADKG